MINLKNDLEMLHWHLNEISTKITQIKIKIFKYKLIYKMINKLQNWILTVINVQRHLN